jgi:hypothetical protein
VRVGAPALVLGVPGRPVVHDGILSRHVRSNIDTLVNGYALNPIGQEGY